MTSHSVGPKLRAHDAHVHLWSNTPPHPELLPTRSARGAPDELLAAMNAEHIGMAAVITPRAMGWDNSASLEAAHDHPNRFVAVARIDVDHPSSAGVLKDAVAAGVRGLRLNVDVDIPGKELLGSRAERIWAVVAAAQIPVALHAASDQLQFVARLVTTHPDITFVLDHLGRPDVSAGVDGSAFRAVLALARHQNLLIKTPNAPFFSRARPPYPDLSAFVSAAIDAFGPGRVVWGSDWPLCTDSIDYAQALEPTLSVLRERPDADRHLIFRANFGRLYHRG